MIANRQKQQAGVTSEAGRGTGTPPTQPSPAPAPGAVPGSTNTGTLVTSTGATVLPNVAMSAVNVSGMLDRVFGLLLL